MKNNWQLKRLLGAEMLWERNTKVSLEITDMVTVPFKIKNMKFTTSTTDYVPLSMLKFINVAKH
jgi:hypothetical protein